MLFQDKLLLLIYRIYYCMLFQSKSVSSLGIGFFFLELAFLNPHNHKEGEYYDGT